MLNMMQVNRAVFLAGLLGLSTPIALAAPFAYVATFTNNVAVIDTATNTVVASVPVGLVPQGVAANPAGTFVYVANGTSNNVSVISTATNTVTATVPVGLSPLGVAANPVLPFVYVTNTSSGNVSVISTATNTVTTTVPVGTGPEGIAV